MDLSCAWISFVSVLEMDCLLGALSAAPFALLGFVVILCRFAVLWPSSLGPWGLGPLGLGPGALGPGALAKHITKTHH